MLTGAKRRLATKPRYPLFSYPAPSCITIASSGELLVRTVIILVLLVLLIPAGETRGQEQDKEQVETGRLQIAGQSYPYRLRRLPLSSFPELPPSVRGVLAQRGCMIPQTWEARRPENVVHGAFFQSGHQDWAVLCSQNGESSLLVFRDGIGVPVELASYKDTNRLAPTNENGYLGYAWGLDTASPTRLRQFAPGQRFDHDGIEASIIEHSSVLHFYRDGQWITIEGLGA